MSIDGKLDLFLGTLVLTDRENSDEIVVGFYDVLVRHGVSSSER